MDLRTIVDFWKPLSTAGSDKRWIHPDDRALLTSEPHSFNLDYPVSPFVGDILTAPVIILGLNAGYDPSTTPQEFSDFDQIDQYIEQVSCPDKSRWRLVSDYYRTSNSWRFMSARQAAWINASPYRSPNLSEERCNRRLAPKLSSTRFHNEWMKQAVLPLAAAGDRLVIVKRKSLWTFLARGDTPGLVSCRSFVGKHLDAAIVTVIDRFLASRR